MDTILSSITKIDNILICCMFSRFQRMQMDIILTSLQENSHVATLLGFCGSNTTECVVSARSLQVSTQLAEVLMKTLLRNLGFYSVSSRQIKEININLKKKVNKSTTISAIDTLSLIMAPKHF